MLRRIEDLTLAERVATVPMADALKANGIKPTHAFNAPPSSAVRRQERQWKSRTHKEDESFERRASTHSTTETVAECSQECRCGRGGFGCCKDT